MVVDHLLVEVVDQADPLVAVDQVDPLGVADQEGLLVVAGQEGLLVVADQVGHLVMTRRVDRWGLAVVHLYLADHCQPVFSLVVLFQAVEKYIMPIY